jgi:hypothetical protein
MFGRYNETFGTYIVVYVSYCHSDKQYTIIGSAIHCKKRLATSGMSLSQTDMSLTFFTVYGPLLLVFLVLFRLPNFLEDNFLKISIITRF